MAEQRARALERARRYSWDAVTEQYEQLLTEVYSAHGPGSLPPFLVDPAPEIRVQNVTRVPF